MCLAMHSISHFKKKTEDYNLKKIGAWACHSLIATLIKDLEDPAKIQREKPTQWGYGKYLEGCKTWLQNT
jgi:hypothetical protein